jgi:predicted membrane protein (TIGR00267 family)
VVAVALVDGLAPLVAALLVLVPFLLAPLLPWQTPPYLASLGIALAALFGIGAFLGTISKEHLLVAGIKTVGAGVVCVAINLVLGAH